MGLLRDLCLNAIHVIFGFWLEGPTAASGRRSPLDLIGVGGVCGCLLWAPSCRRLWLFNNCPAIGTNPPCSRAWPVGGWCRYLLGVCLLVVSGRLVGFWAPPPCFLALCLGGWCRRCP